MKRAIVRPARTELRNACSKASTPSSASASPIMASTRLTEMPATVPGEASISKPAREQGERARPVEADHQPARLGLHARHPREHAEPQAGVDDVDERQ